MPIFPDYRGRRRPVVAPALLALAFAGLVAVAPAVAPTVGAADGTVAAAASGAAPVRVLAADARGVEFDYLPGEPVRLTGTDPLGATAYLEFEGTSPIGGAGTPLLPARTERILLPLGAGYRLHFTVDGEREIDGLRFPVEPPPPIRRQARREPVAVPPADWPPLEDRAYPDFTVREDRQEFRGRQLLLVTMVPVSYNPVRGTARIVGRIHVRVDFTGGAVPAAAGTTVRDPAFEPVWNSLLLNPEGAAAARPGRRAAGSAGPGSPAMPAGFPAGRPAPAAAGSGAGIPTDYFDDAAVWVKISVKQNGLYRVTGQQLVNAGVSLAGIDPATIRMFAGSGQQLPQYDAESTIPGWGEAGGFREIAIRVEEQGTPDGVLSASESLYFYGLGVDNYRSWYDPSLPREWVENEHTDTAVYWVTWGGTFSAAGSPLRMADEDATPVDGAAETTSVRDYLHVEVNDASLYDTEPYESGVRWEKWWWREISSENAGYPDLFNVVLPDVDVSRRGTLLARWWGAALIRGAYHYLTVSVNDSTLPTISWLGLTRRRDMAVDSFQPRTGNNRITAFAPRVGEDPDRIDVVYLAWFEFTYWKTLNLSRNAVWFEADSAEAGPLQYRVTGAGADAAVYDVTDAHHPFRLLGALSGEGSTRTLGFRVAAPAGRRFLLLNPAGVLTPAALEMDAKPDRWLRDPANSADGIIVAWDGCLAAAEELAAWRRGHLRGITSLNPSSAGPVRQARVVVARVSDIYDEFSGGLADPAAIRNFLQYAFNEWGAADPTLPPPAYVCLMGDANRDTRDRQATGVKNMIPTWQNGWSLMADGVSQFSTDDYFSLLGGARDYMPDLAVGRLPVLGAAQARTLVENKIIRSEQFSGVNPDRNRAIMVADDVCQAGSLDHLSTDHISNTEAVSAVVPGAFDLRKIYLYDYGGYDCSLLYKPSAKRDLLAAINEGGWLVTYIGHGGDQQLADEKVLEVTDATALSNLDNLPILVGASCSVGRFDKPGSEGLAEVTVKSTGGGFLAAIAATTLTYSSTNTTFCKNLVQRFFPGGGSRSVPIGMAFLAAKLVNAGSVTSYVLLGDPGSTLITADRLVRFAAPPDTLTRGSLVTLTGEVLLPDSTRDTGFNGTLDLLVQDEPVSRQAAISSADQNGAPYLLPGATLFTGRAAVTAGSFTATFVVPVSLRGGPDARIRAYVAGPAGEGVGAIDPIPIGGSVSGAADTTAPGIAVTLPSGRAAAGEPLEAVIADSSGINLTRLFEFRSVLLSLLDASGEEQYQADVTPEFSYDEGSHTRGRVRTTLPDIASGRYKVRVTATDNFNNRGEGTLDVELGTASTRVNVTRLYGLPNPFRGGETMQISFTLSEGGTVRVSLFSVSGRKVREWSLDGVAGENRVAWDGTDSRGDAVANGVYLVRVAVRSAAGRKADLVEPIVRAR